MEEQYARLDRWRADLVEISNEVAKLCVAIETGRSIEGLVETGRLTEEMARLVSSAVDEIKSHPSSGLRSWLEKLITSERPNWMYTNSLESAQKDLPPDLLYMWSYMKQWVLCQRGYNFFYFFKLVLSGIADGYTTVATQELDELKQSQKFIESRIANIEQTLVESLKLVERIRENGMDMFLDGIKEGDFESVVTDPMSRNILRITWDKITESPTNLSVAKQTGFDIENPVIRTIIDSTDGKIGHSGTSVGWLRVQMRAIFKEGWRAWVVACLKADGIINEDGTVFGRSRP